MNIKYNKVIFSFLAILAPFLALVISIRKNNINFYKIIFPLFYAIVGYTFQVRGGSDATRAVELFEEVKQINTTLFFEKLSYKLCNYSSEGLEIFQFVFSFLIGSFSSDYRLVLSFYGLVSGFFVYKIVQELLKINGKGNHIFIFFILISLMPVTVINGRFWLATTILIYGFLKYIKSNFKIKYLFLCSLIIFIHQGYFFGIIFLFLSHLINKSKIKEFIVYIIFGISLIFSTDFAVNYAKNAASNFGGTIERQISDYVDEEYLEKTASIGEGNSRSLIWKIYNFKNDLFYYSVLIFSIMITFFNKNKTSDVRTLFLVFLMIGSLSNFTIGIPNFGSRYRTITAIIGLVYIYILSKRFKSLKCGYLIKILIPVLYFVFLINLRYEFEQMNFFAFFSNIPMLLYNVPEVTVMDFIK